MHPEPKTLLRDAILKCFPILQPLVKSHQSRLKVWRRVGKSRWEGRSSMAPDLWQILAATHQHIEQAGSAFAESFFLHHPEYDGMFGFAGLGQINLGQPRASMLAVVIETLWTRHKTFRLDESKVDEVVAEFEAFVDNPTVRFQFIAQLLNFELSGDSVELEALRIRRMTPREVSLIYPEMVAAPRVVRIQEACIEGEVEEPKLLRHSEDEKTKQPMTDRAKLLLDQAVIGLQASKEGRVGYGSLHFHPLGFCPYTPQAPAPNPPKP